MDSSREKDLNLQEHLDKCRFCLRERPEDQKFVEITSTVEKRFFDLTQITLIESIDLSRFICDLCENDLNICSNFRLSLIEKQKKLYRARAKLVNNESDDEYVQEPKILIKTEQTDDDDFDVGDAEEIFVDCSSLGDVKTEPGVVSDEILVQTSSRPKRSKNKVVVVKDEEHKELLAEFRQICKKTKDRNIECPRCFKLLDRGSVKEHINVLHFQQKDFECDKCDYKASRFARIMMHMKAVHKQSIDPKYDVKKLKRQCNHCGAMIKNWRRHVMKVHMNIKNFYCDLCPYSSFFKYDMELHIKVHIRKHVKEVEKFYCESCGLAFDKKFHLNAHVKTKHSVRERVYECEICQKSFFSGENLRKHKESHNARDMPCEFCGKLFTCINNLRTHLYYHADPKFVCDFPSCDKKFYQRKRLRAHLKTHKGQKDFVCSFCEKGYYSNNDLNRHIFAIHQKLRFFCQVEGCHGSFSRREYYKKHAIAHHQNLGPEEFDNLLLLIKDAQPSQKA